MEYLALSGQREKNHSVRNKNIANGIQRTCLKKGQTCIQLSKPLVPQERQVLKCIYGISSCFYSQYYNDT